MYSCVPFVAPVSMVFGCGAIMDTLPYAVTLLEESFAFIGSFQDQQEIAPKGALVHHPKNAHPL